MLQKLTRVFITFFTILILIILIEFTIINIVLGCKSFDRTKWTDDNSCLFLNELPL
jgi:hypothetical protein